MELFCNDAELKRREEREKRCSAAFLILAGCTLAVFIILCTQVRTDNASAMHLALILSTAVLGWGCILLYMLGVKESRTQLGHLKMLREGEKEILEGRLTVTDESIQIPKSIRIRKILLDTGEEEKLRLNLDEAWVSRMPPEGSLVRLTMAHSYVAGIEVPERAEGPAPKTGKDKLRKAGALIPLLGIWALAAVFVSSFVFYQITDTDPSHKITVYIDGQVRNETALAVRMEKELKGRVRMVQVHPFKYFMFGEDVLRSGDVLIIPDSHMEEYAEWVAPGEEGRVVFDPETGMAVAGEYVVYTPEEEAPETWRLYLGVLSPHLEDGLAREAADILINMKEEAK